MLNLSENTTQPYVLKILNKCIECCNIPIEYPEYNIVYNNATVFKTLTERIALNAKALFNTAHSLGYNSIPHFLMHDEHKQKLPYGYKTLTNTKGHPMFILLECFQHTICEFHAKDLKTITRLVDALNNAYIKAFTLANKKDNTPYIEHNEFYM